MMLAEGEGRLDAMAYGARRPASRFAGLLQPMLPGEACLERRRGASLWTLKEFEREAVGDLPEDWRHAMALGAAAELLVLGGPEEGTEENLYPAARALRTALETTPDPYAPVLAFAAAWSVLNGFGLPEAAAGSAARRFLEHAVADPPSAWRRYRLSSATRRAVLVGLVHHVERHAEASWKGARILAGGDRPRDHSA